VERARNADWSFLRVQVQKAAEKAGVAPQELCDANADIFRALADRANISYDYFARTSDHGHKSAVQSAWVRGYRAVVVGWGSVLMVAAGLAQRQRLPVQGQARGLVLGRRRGLLSGVQGGDRGGADDGQKAASESARRRDLRC
jgi:hypothetical protein